MTRPPAAAATGALRTAATRPVGDDVTPKERLAKASASSWLTALRKPVMASLARASFPPTPGSQLKAAAAVPTRRSAHPRKLSTTPVTIGRTTSDQAARAADPIAFQAPRTMRAIDRLAPHSNSNFPPAQPRTGESTPCHAVEAPAPRLRKPATARRARVPALRHSHPNAAPIERSAGPSAFSHSHPAAAPRRRIAASTRRRKVSERLYAMTRAAPTATTASTTSASGLADITRFKRAGRQPRPSTRPRPASTPLAGAASHGRRRLSASSTLLLPRSARRARRSTRRRQRPARH